MTNSKQSNISEWYLEVVDKAGLATYGPAKGTMIIKPYGYAIWENIQKFMNDKFKEKGIENCYFPLFIPMSLLQKEKDHVEGFAPECAVVTIGGGEELEDKLIVRPTSETIMYQEYAKMVSSYRDLPILYNQWNNVVRWEKRTYPFMRTSEFLWQEGHTAHRSHKESLEYVLWALDKYYETYAELLAIHGVKGWKSQSEKFAGAKDSTTIELLMPSGKALQGCTSHDLGDNFSKVFDIKFQNEKGELEYVWQTSFGYTTRSIGAMIMAHGDDKGLVLPPEVAPIQVIIVLIKDTPELVTEAENVKNKLNEMNIRVKIDNKFDNSFGERMYDIDMKGIPVKIIIGEKELNQIKLGKFNISDRLGNKYSNVELSEIKNILDNLQNQLLANSKNYLKDNTRTAKNYDEFKEILETHRGFVEVWWNEDKEIEKKIKEETKATTRCKPFDQIGIASLGKLDAKSQGDEQTEGVIESGIDFMTGEKSNTKWLFAVSY